MEKEIKVILRVDESEDWEHLVFYKNGVLLDDGLEDYHLTVEEVLDKMAELGIIKLVKEEISEDD